MDITQVRVKAILKDAWLELKTTELAMVAVIPTCDSMEGIASAPTICYVCDSPNHMACDCSHLTRETERRLSDPPSPKKTLQCFQCTKPGHLLWNPSRKGLGGGVYSASLVPWKNVKVCAASASRMELSQIKKIQY